MKSFLALFGIPLGFLLIYYRERVKRFTGDIAFAEKYLGSGGTYTFLTILGVLIVILSLLWLFGVFDIFIENTIGRFFP